MIESAGKNRFIEIDSIRGLCAIIILLNHYTGYVCFTDHRGGWFLDFIDYAKYIVNLFFILSGLLIFMIFENLRHPGYFIVSRFSRLYPAYWVCIALTALAVTISPYYPDAPVTVTQFFANLTMFQHWMFIRDIDTVYWTLAVELCFYVLIFFVFLFRQQKNIERIGIAWLALMVLLFFLYKQQIIPNANYYYYIPLLRNGNLFFAGILFHQLKKNPSDKRKHILVAMTALIHFFINSTDEAVSVCFLYLLLYLFVFDKLKFLRNNITYFLGYICYPLYLLHQFIGYEIINYLNDSGVKSIYLKIPITGLIVISLAALVTFAVEQPAMKFLRKKMLPGPTA